MTRELGATTLDVLVFPTVGLVLVGALVWVVGQLVGVQPW